MFESALLFQKKQRRVGPMTAAIVVETAVIALLIFAPLFFKTDDLKKFILVGQIFIPPQPPPGTGSKKIETKKPAGTIKKKPEYKPADTTPTEIPKDIFIEKNGGNKDEPEKIEEGGSGCDTPNCVPGGTGEKENKESENKKEPEPQEPPTTSPSSPQPTPPRVGGNVKQAKLIHKVEPIYPPLARQNRVQGDVVLEAIIGIDGNTHNIKVISGHTLLRQSAVDAVEQWKYEPATLNGESIESITTITVKYILK